MIIDNEHFTFSLPGHSLLTAEAHVLTIKTYIHFTWIVRAMSSVWNQICMVSGNFSFFCHKKMFPAHIAWLQVITESQISFQSAMEVERSKSHVHGQWQTIPSNILFSTWIHIDKAVYIRVIYSICFIREYIQCMYIYTYTLKST